MNGRRSSSVLCYGWRLTVPVVASIFLVTSTAIADSWYEHYAAAEQALEKEDWAQAVAEINGAIGKKGDSGARVRSYGMNVVAYFPYLKLGIAYFHLGQYEAALQAFETESRLGAIELSDDASSELEHFRTLAHDALQAAAAEAQRAIREIVRQRIDEARDLEAQGRLADAMAALDQALAVAPDDVDAQAAMTQLREQFAVRERDQDRDRRARKLVADGRALVNEGRYSEASSLFREAQFLTPNAAVQALLDDAQARLLAEIEGSSEYDDWESAINAWMQEVQQLESTRQLAAALDRLQSVLVLDPAHAEALATQGRLLRLIDEAEAEQARLTAITTLLAEAQSQIEAGSAEEALAAANRVLALDPGNPAALDYIGRAYGVISQALLGPTASSNIPPAVRFVDLRSEGRDGLLVQTLDTPDFRLSGVIIDNSPVDVVFYENDSEIAATRVDSQPLGDFFVTEFSIESTLPPGDSTFRLVATDAENLSASSEYYVVYTRPVYRAPWFSTLLLGIAAAVVAALLWRRARHRQRLRTRRFNPYVAGAPVLEDAMFFGRRDLVDRILQTIHNNSLLIYGERRIGKTSIQHQLKKRLCELEDPIYEFYPVYVDLQGTPETQFFQTIAEDIFEELESELNGMQPSVDSSADYSYRDFVSDLRAVMKALEQRTTRKARLVLLIDEVDELNDYDPRINQKLRSLFMKNFAESIVAVVSGVEIKKQWQREGSPWYNFFEEIEVKPLEPEEARALIERPIGGVFKIDGGVAERIISLTAGKPYLIQKMCISLVTRLHEQHRYKITVADVEAVAQPTIDRDTAVRPT